MFWKKKKIDVPASNETKQVEAVELTYVSWRRRYGVFSGDTDKCVEAFPNKKDANDFAASLKAAFKLLKHTGEGTSVEVNSKFYQ